MSRSVPAAGSHLDLEGNNKNVGQYRHVPWLQLRRVKSECVDIQRWVEAFLQLSHLDLHEKQECGSVWTCALAVAQEGVTTGWWKKTCCSITCRETSMSVSVNTGREPGGETRMPVSKDTRVS